MSKKANRNGAMVPAAAGDGKPAQAGENSMAAALEDASEETVASLLEEGGYLEEGLGTRDEGRGAPDGALEGEADTDDGADQDNTDADTDGDAGADAEGDGEGEPDADAEGEGEGEGDGEDGELPENVQRSVNKRIGKEVGKRKQAESERDAARAEREAAQARVAELEAELSANRSGASAAGDDPLGNVRTQAELRKQADEVREVIDFAEDNLARLARSPQAVDRALRAQGVKGLPEEDGVFTAEAMEEFLIGVRRKARRKAAAIPARSDYLRQEAEFSAAAEKEFPELKKPESQFFKDYTRVLQAFPEVRRAPHWKGVAAIYALGLQRQRELRAEAEAAKNRKPAAKPPGWPGARKAAAAKPAAGAARESATMKKFIESGGDENALADHLAATM